MKMDSVQVDILAANKVNVTKSEWGVRGPGAEVQPAQTQAHLPVSSVIPQGPLARQQALRL